MRTHQAIDRRSLDLHRLVAEKIRADPALADAARATLARWRQCADPRSQPYLREWERLFAAGLELALSVATEDSEHGAAMRQASPFCGVLANRERFRFLREWQERVQEAD